jgi:hypothetical protein
MFEKNSEETKNFFRESMERDEGEKQGAMGKYLVAILFSLLSWSRSRMLGLTLHLDCNSRCCRNKRKLPQNS